MNKPPDQAQRDLALDPSRSILVQAPAGSGKTTLLTERFLRLLAEVEEPGQVVAITFTNAAAAEMRNRILDELRKATRMDSLTGEETERRDSHQQVIEEILEVLAAAQRPGHAPQKAVIAPVDTAFAALAMGYGICLEGFLRVIDGSAVRHTLNKHGNRNAEGRRGQVAITRKDFETIPQILAAPEFWILGTKNKIGREQIVSVMKMPDGITIYIEEIRRKNKELATASMWKYPATMDVNRIESAPHHYVRGDSETKPIVIRNPKIGNRKPLQADADGGFDSSRAAARRALEHSETLDWKLLDLPAQLRVCTIDSFCRELALQQPLLSGLGGGLEIAEQPKELYRRAARETLRNIDESGSALSAAIEDLLLWRDNGWAEMEGLLIEMLGSRDRWMHDFVLEREPDWNALRELLERPFASAVREALIALSGFLDHAPGARQEALALARFACAQSGGLLHQELAELAELPSAPFTDMEEARSACAALAELLLIGTGTFRKQINVRLGFPADRKREKARLTELIAQLAAIPGLEAALAAVRALPPARYTEEEWQIVRACFTLLRHAAGELRIAFAEAGRVDFIEVAQVAQRVLRGEDGLPTDAALAVSDGIRHLLVDEFQDTSRRQHQLLASLIAAWPERTGRSCFVVGDPMQSIYSFRDADAELFPRVQSAGLEIPHEEPLRFDFAPLKANFRTAPGLVERLNRDFEKIFAADDGSGVRFSAAMPAREDANNAAPAFALHLDFVPSTGRGNSADAEEKEAARAAQIDEIIALIRSHGSRMETARAAGEKFRIAVLGRARSALAPIAAALREAKIPFRAIDLEKLADRPEVLDALALARALLNPLDRVAWLGLLRVPWCGLSLEELHALAGDGVPDQLTRPVPELLAGRLSLLSQSSQKSAERVLQAITAAATLRSTQPAVKLGSWLEQIWILMGGAACVDSAARANLDLLWSCLDRLPGGEEDLLGPALAAALDNLTALPDPAAASDCGVQLMTIHKAKGLEFEVVIVPELQAANGRGGYKMLSWLERGLAQPDESGEITEFLIAPFQRKGEERGSAKAWVDQVYRARESQETRRILYVAATRAREELHLFARPVCHEKDGEFTLATPSNSLLATAWPALEEEVRARFEEWKGSRTGGIIHEDQIESIAASGELLVMPSPIRPTQLRRLPADFSMRAGVCGAPSGVGVQAVSSPVIYAAGAPGLDFETGDRSLYPRHEGGLLSRALGRAVHSLLEELARLRATLDWEAACAALQRFEPRIAAQVRAVGVDPIHAGRIGAEALQIALTASHDPIGSWILSPHKSVASEAAWAGVVAGSLRAVRIDRVFQAGPAPCREGGDCWWIIDYKTAHAGDLDLPALRSIFAPQVEAYAQLLRNQIGTEADIFAGLYYPRSTKLDWWQL